MKLLAISDAYLPAPYLRQGLQPLQELGVEIEIRDWTLASLVALQEANLEIERQGPNAVDLPGDLVRDLQDVQILVVQFAPVGRQFLQAAPSLRVIGVLRSGAEGIDLPAASERGIAVLNTPGRNARAVAECTLGLILAEIRNLARSHAELVQGRWQRKFPNSDAIPELHGKTVGLVGYGAVGRHVAHYLQALGSRILAYDPFARGDTAPAELVDLATLLAEADVVSLHARLTDQNHHLIGKQELARMKPTAILVNTARSGLIDEAALVEALAARRIMGAALDVFDSEPLAPGNPLLGLPNVTLTPHLAGSTVDAFRGSPALLAGHLARMLQGERDIPLVNGIWPDLRTAAREHSRRETLAENGDDAKLL